jgi:hypothetical protein
VVGGYAPITITLRGRDLSVPSVAHKQVEKQGVNPMTIATTSKLLLDEEPLLVLPSLATKIGLNESIVLQQLHYWVAKAAKKKRQDRFQDGRYWVYNTYEAWREGNFPWWSAGTIQRIFLKLEKLGLVLARRLSKNKSDRKKYYTIDYNKLAVIDNPHSRKLLLSTSQVVTMHHINVRRWIVSKCDDGYTETTQRLPETKDSSTAGAAEVADHDEPDGTVMTNTIEARYGVQHGQDWLAVKFSRDRNKKSSAVMDAWWNGIEPEQRPKSRGRKISNPYEITGWRKIADGMVDDGHCPEDVAQWLEHVLTPRNSDTQFVKGRGKYIGEVVHLAAVASEMPAWIKATPVSGNTQNGSAPAPVGDDITPEMLAEHERIVGERRAQQKAESEAKTRNIRRAS